MTTTTRQRGGSYHLPSEYFGINSGNYYSEQGKVNRPFNVSSSQTARSGLQSTFPGGAPSAPPPQIKSPKTAAKKSSHETKPKASPSPSSPSSPPSSSSKSTKSTRTTESGKTQNQKEQKQQKESAGLAKKNTQTKQTPPKTRASSRNK